MNPEELVHDRDVLQDQNGLESPMKTETYVGNCFSCSEESELRDMAMAYEQEGNVEVYSDMLAYCFSINVSNEVGYDSNTRYLMCPSCVAQLRAAAAFRRQLEATRTKWKTDDKTLVRAADDVSSFDRNIKSDPDSPDELIPLTELSKNRRGSGTRRKPTARRRKLIKKEQNQNLLLVIKEDSGSECETMITLKNRKVRKKKEPNVKVEEEDEEDEKYETLAKGEKKEWRTDLPYEIEKTDLDCRVCQESFRTHRTLIMHMSLHYPHHICEFCGNGYASRKQLLAHVRVHRRATQACPVCQQLFRSGSSLRVHVLRAHRGERFSHKCPQCPEKFTNYYSRRNHLTAVHSVEMKKYQCKQCPSSFLYSHTLSSHVVKEHLNQRNHCCTQCDKTFFLKVDLKKHMLTHTGERNYPCNVCGKRYLRRYTLKEHLKIHSGERSHVCAVCGRAFTQRCTLKGHMAVHDKEAARLNRARQDKKKELDT